MFSKLPNLRMAKLLQANSTSAETELSKLMQIEFSDSLSRFSSEDKVKYDFKLKSRHEHLKHLKDPQN